MKYNTQHKDAIESIIVEIEKDIDKLEFEKNIYSTRTLCRCFLSSIFSQIRSAYLAIESRESIGFNILHRSLSEHLIDLLYIANKNDTVCNRRFINYFKLVQYWRRNDFEHFKQEISKIEERYREYVLEEFSDIVKKMKRKNDISALLNWKEVDRHIRNLYRKSWSGLNAVDRVNAVQASANHELIQEYLPFTFRFMSNYTHPTVFSCVPYFDFINGSFELKFDKSADNMKGEESAIYLVLTFSIEIFCQVLDKKEGEYLDSRLEQLLNKYPELSEIKNTESN